MTKRTWLVALLAVMWMASGAVWAQEDTTSNEDAPSRKTRKARRQKKTRAPKVRKARKGEWEKKWAPMASQLGLSPEQTAALKQKVDAKKQALAEWNSTHAAKLGELKTAMKQAKKDGKKDEVKKIKGQMGEMNKARKNIESAADAACMGVLTKEQTTRWQGIQFCSRAMRKYRKAGLDETQQAKVKELCLAAATRIASADRKARKGMIKALHGDIQKLLTDAQREKMNARGNGKDRREKKADKPRRAKTKKTGRGAKQAEIIELD